MGLDDFLEPEVAVAAVIVAAITSPRARGILRKGLVYTTAGALMAGDAIASMSRNIGRGFQQTPATGEPARSEGHMAATGGQ